MAVKNETSSEPTVFDSELEILKLQGRFRWLVDEINELKAKDRSLSARISRLKSSIEEEGLEEFEEEREEVRPTLDLSKIPAGTQLDTSFAVRPEEP